MGHHLVVVHLIIDLGNQKMIVVDHPRPLRLRLVQNFFLLEGKHGSW